MNRRKDGIRSTNDSLRMYASLDLHKKYAQAVVMNEAGAVLKEERIESDPSFMERLSDSLEENTDVVIESSSTWHWAYQILARKHHVVLANPARTKAIAQAKIKTDKIDALTLANLLRGGYIAESYIPPKKVMELRDLVRYRANLVRIRTNIKNRIHAYLLMNNIKMDQGNYPFSKAYVEELRTKAEDEPKVQGYLNILSTIEEEILEASALITNEATNNDDAKLLVTIPGVSFYSALMLVAEIGDVNRFSDSHHLMSYAGLIPSTHPSGGITYHGRITKTGSPYLRWILNQCAWSNVRTPEGKLAMFYSRLSRKKGSRKAITATSAKLLRIIYQMMKRKQPYHDS